VKNNGERKDGILMGKRMRKTILAVINVVIGALGGAVGVGKVMGKRMEYVQQSSDKHLELFLMMDQWVKVKQRGLNLSIYFEKNGYKRIAVYGMSYVGETLVDELKGTDIEIAYGIDKRADSLHADVDIISVEGKLEEVDAIVVTAITYFHEIEKKLSEKAGCPILSLEDILYEV
jgi:hypothetical protein